MIEATLNFFESISKTMPLPAYILIGSLAEEIIAFIPSPFILTLSGSLAASQGQNIFFLVLLGLIATFAKTIGSYVFYIIADKAEDIITGKFGRVFGLSHKGIESIGKKLEKSSRDEVAIFFLRATPLVPTAPVSIVAGILKLELKSYLLASAAGLFVRSMFFLYLGYTAKGTLDDLSNQLSGLESIGRILLLVLAGIGLVWFYKKRKSVTKDQDKSK